MFELWHCILSFFLEKNETKKSSLLSNRSAFKGVRRDMHALRDQIRLNECLSINLEPLKTKRQL